MTTMVYNSDTFVVVELDVPVAATADDRLAAGDAPLSRGGYEIVDKFARKEIYLEGALAQHFREGVEELARNEKYQIRTWNLDQQGSIRHVIARLNQIRRAHPALHTNRGLTFHPTDNDLVIAYSKVSDDGKDAILTVVNLDPHHRHSAWITLDLAALGIPADEGFQVHDLLGDARYSWRGARTYVELDPAQSPAHIFELRRFVRSENHFEYFL